MSTKPELSFRQIWNMCVGFLGIQFAFSLQNADVSRIFQTLGANLREIPILWVAAPLSGLIVQPIIGYASDHTWTRLGRRHDAVLLCGGMERGGAGRLAGRAAHAPISGRFRIHVDLRRDHRAGGGRGRVTPVPGAAAL